LLLAVFLAWLVVLGWRNHDHLARGAAPALTLGVSLALILGGLIGVVVGGYWVVGGAKVLATLLGVSEHLIGLTVVAIGTSVPELAVSLTAIFYRQNSLAVGNVIGSNIFDFLGIIGLSAIWRGLPLVESLNFDLGVTALAALLLWLLVVVHPRFKLERWHGFLFLLIYAFYFAFLLARG
jgi:cation:H+ antiporter